MSKREAKKAYIIKKAREIFLEKGLFSTVMDDIAGEVGLTRRTLYRYFETKEDLAYETTIQLLNEWNAFHIEVFDSLEGNGIHQLNHFLNALIDYMANRVNVMKYLGEFDFYFKDEKVQKPSTESMIRFKEIILESDTLLTRLVELGMEDGSIKKNMDVKMMVTTISNVLWSFGQRIAIRSDLIKEESGFSGIELIKNQVAIYMMALKTS